jgi:hypothetical protein
MAQPDFHNRSTGIVPLGRFPLAFYGEMQMGHYIWTGEAVGAIPGNRECGENIYLLFTKGCENNISPRTEKWNPQYMGTYEEIVDHAFRLASSAEGGMIRSKGGSVLPETLIARIIKCLESPFQVPRLNIRAKKGRSLYSAIPQECCEEICERLRDQRQLNLVDALEEHGFVELNTWDDAQAITALSRAGVSLWTMFHIDPENYPLVHGYGRKYATGPGQVPSGIEVCRLGMESLVVVFFAGKWRIYWTYEAVEHFITTVAKLHERQYPGSFKKAIREFRQQCQNAPILGDGAGLRIDPDADSNSWLRGNAKKVAGSLGETGAFTTTLGIIRAKGQFNKLWHLGECLEWLIPKPESWQEQPLFGLS